MEIKQGHEQEEAGKTMLHTLFLSRWLAPLTRRNVSRATCRAKFHCRFAGQVAFTCTGQVSWLLAANAARPTFPSQPLKPFSSEILDSGMLPRYPLISIRGFARGQALTSYSSATVAGFHRLPYSACSLRNRPPGANSSMLFVNIVYESGEDSVNHQNWLSAHCPSGQLTRRIEKTDTTI